MAPTMLRLSIEMNDTVPPEFSVLCVSETSVQASSNTLAGSVTFSFHPSVHSVCALSIPVIMNARLLVVFEDVMTVQLDCVVVSAEEGICSVAYVTPPIDTPSVDGTVCFRGSTSISMTTSSVSNMHGVVALTPPVPVLC